MRRLAPILILLALLLIFVVPLPLELDAPALRFTLFLLGAAGWALYFRAGVDTVDKDSSVIRQDAFGTMRAFHSRETFVFIPGYHTKEATLPNYPIKCEFEIAGIDTRTPGLQRIDKIKVRVMYRIVDARQTYERATYFTERIKEIADERKIDRSDPSLWKQLMSELVAGVVDDAIRVGVWHWADTLVRDPNLNLVTPFPLPPNTEYDPYALSLNRDRLAAEILDEVQYQTDEWGMQIDRLVFENFEINPEIIKRKVRNKDRELADAEHEARMAAAAITIKGEAEVEIRARTVARVIEVLLEQQRRNGLNLSNDVLYNVVRAAMYSDGQTIWKGVIEKSATPPGTAKTA